MGLFNVIRLANDYIKAKKILKSKKIDKIKIKEYIDKMQDYIHTLNETKDTINIHILKVREVMRGLSDLLKSRKEGK